MFLAAISVIEKEEDREFIFNINKILL